MHRRKGKQYKHHQARQQFHKEETENALFPRQEQKHIARMRPQIRARIAHAERGTDPQHDRQHINGKQ